MEHPRRRGIGHDHKAEGVEEGPGAEHARGAETVGDGAGEGLADAPEQILDGDRQPEDVASPTELARHRHLEQAGRGARSKADQGDQTTRKNDELGRDPGLRGRGGHAWLPAELPRLAYERAAAKRAIIISAIPSTHTGVPGHVERLRPEPTIKRQRTRAPVTP